MDTFASFIKFLKTCCAFMTFTRMHFSNGYEMEEK